MTDETDGIPLPPRLRRLAQRLAAEEVAAVYRHDLTGKLGAARMLVHTLKRRVLGEGSPFAGDERVTESLELVDSAVRGALALAERSLLPEVTDEHDPTDLADVVADVVGAAGIDRVQVSAPAPTWVDAAADDLAIALVALVENALEASDGPVEVRCSSADGRARLEVVDRGPGVVEPAEDAPPFVSEKRGRLALGLRIAKRVARRWRGSLDIAREGDLTVARLELPSIRGAGSVE